MAGVVPSNSNKLADKRQVLLVAARRVQACTPRRFFYRLPCLMLSLQSPQEGKMKTKIGVETPFGDFDLVPTDFSKGCSCEQCAAAEIVECCIMCFDFDTESTKYHFERRTK